MKNISDVIRQKERELQQLHTQMQQVQTELDALQLVSRLLADDAAATVRPAPGDNGAAKRTPQSVVAAALNASGDAPKQFP